MSLQTGGGLSPLTETKAIKDCLCIYQPWLACGYKSSQRWGYMRLTARRDLPRRSRPLTILGPNPYTHIYPVKLSDSREVLWLKLNGRWSKRGYRSVEVLDTPLRTNTAILAALTAVEAKPIETDLLSKYMSHFKAPLREPMMLHHGDMPEELWKEFLTLVDHPTPDYVVALLRYYRPEFDDLPHKEKLDLIKEGCARVNTFLESLRRLEAFLEYGVPEQDLRSRMEKVQQDIKAAELKDVE